MLPCLYYTIPAACTKQKKKMNNENYTNECLPLRMELQINKMNLYLKSRDCQQIRTRVANVHSEISGKFSFADD